MIWCDNGNGLKMKTSKKFWILGRTIIISWLCVREFIIENKIIKTNLYLTLWVSLHCCHSMNPFCLACCLRQCKRCLSSGRNKTRLKSTTTNETKMLSLLFSMRHCVHRFMYRFIVWCDALAKMVWEVENIKTLKILGTFKDLVSSKWHECYAM